LTPDDFDDLDDIEEVDAPPRRSAEVARSRRERPADAAVDVGHDQP
jgi:hypothetical protein